MTWERKLFDKTADLTTTVCPLCSTKKHEISEHIEIEAGQIYIDFSCPKGHKWTNEYKLIAYLYDSKQEG